jgi:hypothetical protein
MKDNGKQSLQDRLSVDPKRILTIISFRTRFNCKEVKKWL